METTANSLNMILYVFIVDGGVVMYILNKVFEGLVVRARVKGRSDHPGLGSLSVVLRSNSIVWSQSAPQGKPLVAAILFSILSPRSAASCSAPLFWPPQ